MAALTAKCFQCFQFALKTCTATKGYPTLYFTKLYSMYAPVFKEPILDPEEIKKIKETEHIENLRAWRIKAAKISKSCSVLYHPDVELFVNYIMRQGKREVAIENLRETFYNIKHIQLRKYKEETDEEKKKEILLKPIDVLSRAIKNSTPLLWFRKIKRSGSWFKVPIGITEEKAKRIAMKWLIESAKDKAADVRFHHQLAIELLDAADYKGKTINKKLELHKMCEANRSYAHYWWT